MERFPHPMTADCPKFLDDDAFKLLRSGDLEGFHSAIAQREIVDFSHTDFRGIDLRGADLRKVILRGCYLRDTDLRGQNLRHHDLDGCSFFHAKISGVWFPENLSAEEIRLTLEYGTRLRTKRA